MAALRALSCKAILLYQHFRCTTKHLYRLLGTPAEEGGGGKVKLLEAGAYEGLDCSLMAHPNNVAYAAYGRTLASWRADVSWTGCKCAPG